MHLYIIDISPNKTNGHFVRLWKLPRKAYVVYYATDCSHSCQLCLWRDVCYTCDVELLHMHGTLYRRILRNAGRAYCFKLNSRPWCWMVSARISGWLNVLFSGRFYQDEWRTRIHYVKIKAILLFQILCEIHVMSNPSFYISGLIYRYWVT